jgi:hypothetical protein
MAIARPFFAYLEELRSLAGEPKVTFPTGDLSCPVIERVVHVLRTQARDYYPGVSEKDATRFPRSFLSERQEVSGDAQHVDLYLRYETAPGRPAGQNAWSYELQFVSESNSHPIYIRRTIEARIGYSAPTKGAAFSGVAAVDITAGGTGYTDGTALSFSGGAGSGAAGTIIVVAGVIVGIYLSSAGAGYTSAPTVSTTTGSGATFSAVVQPITALLQHEERRPADGADAFKFWEITRVYETLPGPTIASWELRTGGSFEKETVRNVVAATVPSGGSGVTLDRVDGIDTVKSRQIIKQLVAADGATLITTDDGFMLKDTDPRTNADIGIIFRVRPYAEALPAVGAALGVGYVTRRRTQSIDGSSNVVQVITTKALADPWATFEEIAVTFPGIIKFNPWSVSDYDGRFQPPWPGDGVATGTVYHLKPRHVKVTGRVIRSQSLGSSGSLPNRYNVYTPGTASKIFSIGNDTVHGPIRVVETTDTYPGGITVENIPASTPATYDAKSILTVSAEEKREDGIIYEKTVIQVSEQTNPYKFGTVQGSKTFTATSSVQLAGQPNPGGERLYLVSTNAADTMVATVYGKRNNSDGERYTEERVTLSGTTPVATDATYLWSLVSQFRLASSAAGTVTLRGSGGPASGRVLATGIPADGDLLQMGRTGLTRTYAYRNPFRGTIVCPAGSTLVTGVAPASYVKITLTGVSHYFWFSNGSTTDPTPGGTGHAVVFTAGETNTALAALLKTAMDSAVGTLYALSISTATITATGILLGAGSLAQDAGNDFTLTSVAAGTAQAADQIRTGWASNGNAFAAVDIAERISLTVNLTGTSGDTYSTATTIHNDLTGTWTSGDDSCYLTGKLAYSSGTWVLTDTSSALTCVAIVDGANGPLIATLTTGQLGAWNNIDFDNTPLVLTAAGWDEASVQPYGAIVQNMPADAGTVTTDAMAIPTGLTGRSLILRLISGKNPPMGVTYQYSTDGVTGWATGTTVAMPAGIGAQKLYDVTLDEVIAASRAYIRLVFTQTLNKTRAVHAELFYPLI